MSECNKVNTTALVVGLTCLLVFLRSLTSDFVNLDDPYLVINNQVIRSLNRGFFVWAFGAPTLELWMPLTWISLAIDYRFWALDPFGYNLTNLVLHATNSALVVLIAQSFYRFLPDADDIGAAGDSILKCRVLWVPLLAGLLFGIHPLRVESVDWITERKDLLNGLFSFGAIYCYLQFVLVRKSAPGVRSRCYYLLSLLLFALSLMAKPVSVVLPAMLLVLDWCPLGRLNKGDLGRLLLEKAPFFALSLAISVATIYFSSKNQLMVKMVDLPMFSRVLVSGNAVFEYCRLLIWPVGILPYYLLSVPIPKIFYLTSLASLVPWGFSLGLIRKVPLFASTWFCFILPLLPVLGFIQSGDQALSPHLTYLPSLFPSITVAAVIMRAQRRLAPACGYRKYVVPILLSVLLLFYIVKTQKMISVWHNTETLWTRVIELRPIGRAYADRGVFQLIRGESAAAVADFTSALEISQSEQPALVYNVYAFRGVALSDLGRYEEAVRDFTAAIDLKPHPTYFRVRGNALKALGRLDEAQRDFMRSGTNTPAIDWY